MRITSLRVTAISIVLLVYSLNSLLAQSKSSDDRQSEVRQAVQRWTVAVRSGDVNRILDSYASGEKLRGVDAVDMPVEFHSTTECRHYWEQALHRPDRILDFQVPQMEVQVADRIGIVEGQWTMERENGQNGKRILSGNLTLILVKQGKEWRIQHEHRSKMKEVFVGIAVGAVGNVSPPLLPAPPEYAAVAWKGDGKSGIEGVATASPVRGGPQRIGEDASAPLSNALITLRPLDDEKPVASVRTDAQGKFRIPLKPGRYRLIPFGPNPEAILPRAAPQVIVVSNRAFVKVQVGYDTGLR